MPSELAELDGMQKSYKEAVDDWIGAVREEEALALVNHELADVDAWERAGMQEQVLRQRAKTAKKSYEDALREKFFHF